MKNQIKSRKKSKEKFLIFKLFISKKKRQRLEISIVLKDNTILRVLKSKNILKKLNKKDIEF